MRGLQVCGEGPLGLRVQGLGFKVLEREQGRPPRSLTRTSDEEDEPDSTTAY